MTTPEQFELYKREIARWINKYNLNDWRVTFEHKRLENLAECCFCYTSRHVVFRLDLDGFEEARTDKDVQRSAYHEVCELLLGPLEWVYRHADVEGETLENLVSAARHAIIRRLEHVEFEQLAG